MSSLWFYHDRQRLEHNTCLNIKVSGQKAKVKCAQPFITVGERFHFTFALELAPIQGCTTTNSL